MTLVTFVLTTIIFTNIIHTLTYYRNFIYINGGVLEMMKNVRMYLFYSNHPTYNYDSAPKCKSKNVPDRILNKLCVVFTQ